MTDLNFGERLAKIEMSVEHIQKDMSDQKEQIGLIHNKLDIFNAHKMECDNKFVKHTDSSYFDKNMKRHENEKLHKNSLILAIANNFYKFLIAIASIVLILNNFILPKG